MYAPKVHPQHHGLRRALTLCGTGESHRRGSTIDMLSGDDLLEIFDSYRKIPVHEPFFRVQLVWSWHLLVHVCRRWRQIIFESPHRLNLQILCTQKTPVKDNLFIWPTLPIVIKYSNTKRNPRPEGVGNVIASFQQANRVCHVELNVTKSMFEKMVPFMLESFPELTHIDIYPEPATDGSMGVLPGEFLGGSGPRLQEISFDNHSFPSLSTFLLSTSNFISLALSGIPPTGYIAPEAVIACLAELPRLKQLIFGFHSVTSRPDQIHPPPITRTVLPALTSFTFYGASEYLEALVAQIDSPKLETIRVECLNSLVDTPAAQFPEFVDRTIGEKLLESSHAQIGYSSGTFSFIMYYPKLHPLWDWFTPNPDMMARVVAFSCYGIGWRVSHVAQVLSRFSSEILSNVTHLELEAEDEEGLELRCMANFEWLYLLEQFPTVKTLLVSSEVSGYVAYALEDITEDIVTDVLPPLELICLDAQAVPLSVENFVAVRRPAGRPVTVVGTTREFNEILKSSYLRE